MKQAAMTSSSKPAPAFGVAADGVDVAADHCAPRHEGVQRDQHRHDDQHVRQAAVRGDHVGEVEHDKGEQRALAEEEGVRLDLDAV